MAGLIQDAAGNLYGTTEHGGAHGYGTVFKLDNTGQETVLYSFCSVVVHGFCMDGVSPVAGLIQDAAGNLYGTTTKGPAYTSGVVFKLDSRGQETVLYSFCSASNCTDGADPPAGLIQDATGNLYGTTYQGGANTTANNNTGGGTVFKLDTAGQETVLYSFCSVVVAGICTDGVSPVAGLIQDAAGNLYGTTYQGGANNQGTVFKLDTTGQETVLYSFCSASNCTDGANPLGGLIQDATGNLYGTTEANGGTVFKLDNTGQETVLYSFCADCVDGYQPEAGLIQDAAGNLYGTTFYGGAQGGGTVFKLAPPAQQGGAWTKTVLYSFCSASNCADGTGPRASLIQDATGDLYGTTYQGGTNNAGTVFELAVPTFTVAGTAVSVSPGATSGNTSTITVTPGGGFTGSVTLTAAITSSPSGAQDPPPLSFGSTSPVSITGTSAVTATLTISTTAPTTGALAYPARPGVRWYAGGTTLAFGLFCGIGICVPGRRSWRTRIGSLLLLVMLAGGLLSCSSSSGNIGTGNPGTTPGAYTITVTGTSGSTTATGTVTLTVQ
jgi:uncharacterized repeat protein (TIGR03803 family)